MRHKFLEEMKEVTKILSESNPLAVKLIKKLTAKEKKRVVPRHISNDSEVIKLNSKADAKKKVRGDDTAIIFDKKGKFFGTAMAPDFKDALNKAEDDFEFYLIKGDKVWDRTARVKKRGLLRPPDDSEEHEDKIKKIEKHIKKKLLSYYTKELPKYISKNAMKIVNYQFDQGKSDIDSIIDDLPRHNVDKFPYDEFIGDIHKANVEVLTGEE